MADATESIGILQFALNAVVNQQQVIANNIANQDNPGYQANHVTFQSSLAAAMQQGGTASISLSPEGLPPGRNGNNVSLATEMTLLQENNLENKLVDNALSAQFAILSAAITA